MKVYSRTIVSFIARLKKEARQILAREVGVKVHRKRFHYQGMLYPINIICFEDERKSRKLGHFRVESFEIGINRALMYQADGEILRNILRHEIAHYLAWLRYGDSVQDHGKEYRQICRQHGWGEEVFSAKLGDEEIRQSLRKKAQEKALLNKVQKLLALGASSNSHEAELATIKANELLIKHNLAYRPRENSEESEYYVAAVVCAPRLNATLEALYHILPAFFVRPVLAYGRGEVRLEVLGTRVNVELADYVAKFLVGEFARLWQQARRDNPHFKGLASKNSFLAGLSQGLAEKLKRTHKKALTGKDLIALKSSLKEAEALAYPQIITRNPTRKNCEDSEAAGKAAGKSITLRPGLKQKTSETRQLPHLSP